MKKLTLLLLSSLLNYSLWGQQIVACDDPATIVLSSFCSDACVLCDDIDGYSGINSSMILGEAPPDFCAGQLHNTQWVGFVAGTENLSFDVSVFNCSLDNDGDGVGEGLQIGVYNTTDCNNWNLVSNCENQVEEGTSATFTNTEPLVPGGIYFLVVDGAFGDICEFSIDVIDGSTTPPMVEQVSPDISTPATACPGGNVEVSVAPVTGAGAYYWTLDGMEVATDQVSTITLPDAVGTYTLCVTPYNPCSQGVEGCTTITVEEPEPNVFEEATICAGDTYTEYGQSFTTAGQYLFTVPTNGACPDVVQLDLSVDQIPEVFLEETVCTGYSFQVGDNSYSVPGDYTTVLVGPNGCDSIVYLSLDIRGADEVIALRPEICEGESFWVAGEELTESGIHVYFLESVDGCDSIIDVDLTVYPPDEIVIDTTICTGQSYAFNGTNYTAPGQYTATFTNQVGCDSTVTVNLAVNTTVFAEIDREICAGQTVSFGGNVYSDPGYYETTLTTVAGCDSVVGLNLSVVDNLLQVEEVTICAGETYPVGGTAYGASGTYSADFTSSAGCDSTYQVNLTVLPPLSTTITPVICPGSSFPIGGESFSTAGTYEVTLTGTAGCDSLVTVQLSVEDQRLGYEALTVCNGESVTVGSETLTVSGLYEFPYTTADGCDSIYQLDLTVLDPIATTLDPEICVGNSFAIAGETYTMPGTYTLTLVSERGCDSLITINLTTTDALVTPLSETICTGDTAYIASTPYTTTGEYEESFVTPEGCDSIVQLSLTVLPLATATIDPVICSGQSYSIGGQGFAAAGQYAVTLTSVTGCDSLVTVNLTVDPPLVETASRTICAGDTVYVADEFYTTTGTYETAYVTAEGCDSLYRLNLEVLPTLNSTVTPVICEGQVFSMAGQEYDQTGSYLVPLTASTGCDSLVTIDLTVTPTTYATIDPLICDGESFSLGSGVYTTTGQYQEVLTSAAGCDSIVTINLTVAPAPSTPLAITICAGESYTVGNETFAAGGQYTIVLSTAEGCDSTVLLDLTITEFYQTQLTEVLCAGESYTLGTTAYSTTGQYQETFTAADGCDSIVTLDLRVDPLLSTSITASICAGEVYPIGGVAYGSTGVHRETVSSLLTGCDSTITLDLTVLPTYDLLVEETICAGESVRIGDSTYTQSGLYPTLLQTAAGCDSLVHLALTVLPLPETPLAITICAGESYAVGNETFAAEGEYTIVLSTTEGCDSTVLLDLTITEFYQTQLTEVLCAGESYTLGTTAYSTTGQYQETFTAADGCDSIVTLDLRVDPLLSTSLTASICAGEVYPIGGVDYGSTGVHRETVPSLLTGCDSTITLDLTVLPTYDLLVEETICAGASVDIGDSTYTQSGLYPTLLQTAAGCDSLVNLALTVLPLPETLLTETICAGETYAVGTSTYAATGTYTDVLPSVVSGCDSIVTLALTVLPIVETPLTIAICDGESYTVGTDVFTESGNYATVLTATQTGCDSIVQLDLVVHPVYETTLTAAICTDETFEVGAESFNTTGVYEVLLSSVAGCDSLVILDLYVAPCALTAEATPKAVNCFDGTDGEIRFAVTIGTPPYTYTWERPDGSIGGNGGIPQNGQEITLTGLTAGEYTITMVDANGVTLTLFSTVEQPAAIGLTVESARYGAYNTSCFAEQDGSLRVFGSGGIPPYSYLWSSGATGASASGLSAGTYTVTVTDANGCTATRTASLQAPPPVQAGTSVTDPACSGDLFGALTVENPAGGTPPYRYAIDGGAFSAGPLFANLEVGAHEVTVQDTYGCEWREEVRVNAPPELTVDLGGDIDMDLGDTLHLDALTSQSVLSYEWSGGPLLGCAGPDSLNCYDPRLAPQESTAYAVRVTDANGCTAEDRIQVFVAKKRKVFIPNAFSPNGDGVNDLFTINAGKDVARIKSFLLFNRWGESVHQAFDFTPNDPAYGWNGRYRGQLLNAGVFVYYAEIEFIDGDVILYQGDVMLMR